MSTVEKKEVVGVGASGAAKQEAGGKGMKAEVPVTKSGAEPGESKESKGYDASLREVYDMAKEGNVVAQIAIVKTYLEKPLGFLDEKEVFAMAQAAAKEDRTGEADLLLSEIYGREIGTTGDAWSGTEHMRASVRKGFRQGLVLHAMFLAADRKRSCSDSAGHALAEALDRDSVLAYAFASAVEQLRADYGDDARRRMAKLDADLSTAEEAAVVMKRKTAALQTELQRTQDELAYRSASRLSSKLAELKQREAGLAEKERRLAQEAEKQKRELEQERVRIQQQAKEDIRLHEQRHHDAEKACGERETENRHLKKLVSRYAQRSTYNLRHPCVV